MGFFLQFPPCVARIASSSGDRGKDHTSASAADDGSRSTSLGKDFDVLSDQSSSNSKDLQSLQGFFHYGDVQTWMPDRFQMISKLQDAARNKGQVHEMYDRLVDKQVAVKQMPNEWVCESHQEFIKCHPGETERPWVDIGCMAYLNSISHPYVC